MFLMKNSFVSKCWKISNQGLYLIVIFLRIYTNAYIPYERKWKMRSLALTLLYNIASEKCESDSNERKNLLWFMAFLALSLQSLASKKIPHY
jgi:hypothetical protein